VDCFVWNPAMFVLHQMCRVPCQHVALPCALQLHVVNLLKVQPEAGQAFCTHLVSSFTSPATDKAEDPATCFR
jgi:hypothetical protein